MPRIRTLKPRFWDSPSTAKADLAPRLLFMAMWNWADDAGRGTANLKELEAFAFPNDEIAELPRRSSRNSAAVWPSFAELFWETVQAYDVTLYKVNGRRYYEINSFREHQSKHFNPESSLPGPDDGEKWDIASEYGFGPRQLPSPPAERRQDSSRNSAVSCREPHTDPPLDKDRDRDKDSSSLTLVEGGPGGDPPIPVAAKAAPAARGTRLPTNWRPDDDTIAEMHQRFPGINLKAEHEKFTNHWRSQPGAKGRKCDWPATWRNWILRAAEQQPHRNGHSPPIGKPTLKALGYQQAADQIIAEMELGQ